MQSQLLVLFFFFFSWNVFRWQVSLFSPWFTVSYMSHNVFWMHYFNAGFLINMNVNVTEKWWVKKEALTVFFLFLGDNSKTWSLSLIFDVIENSFSSLNSTVSVLDVFSCDAWAAGVH